MKLTAIFALLAGSALGQVVFPPASGGGGGGGATIPSVTTLIKGDGAGNGASTKVTLTAPTTAWTIQPAADNQTTIIPTGTLMSTATTVLAAQMPALTGDCTTSAGAVATACSAIGGKTVTLSGNLTTTGAFNPTFAIPSSSTWTFPSGGGTLVNSAVATLSSLTSIGTIGTGVWQGTLIGSTYGGTGVNNGSATLTMAGNVTYAGAFTHTFTATGNTSLTLPVSGTLAILGANTFTAVQAMLGWTCYDPTATTGATVCKVRAGAGDASGAKLLAGYLNDGTTEKWSITRDGSITGTKILSGSGGVESLGGAIDIFTAGNYELLAGNSFGGVKLPSSTSFWWSSTASAVGTGDTGLSRNAAGLVEVNSGTAGRYADIKVRHLRTGSVATYAPAPTVGSGFGTSPSIAGTDSAGRITIGTPTGTSGVIAFGTAWATAPACTANDEITGVTITTASTTTQVTLAGSFVAADTVVFNCIGY